MYGQFESHLHDVPCRVCVSTASTRRARGDLPSGAIYKREDGIVLIDRDKCRGWRMCITGCPYKKIYFNWKSGKSEVHLLLPTYRSRYADRLLESCVGPYSLPRRAAV